MKDWLLNDARFGIRMLAKSAGFSALAVLTLALGIGATTAIFTVINALLLEPLPYADSSRLVIVTNARGQNRRPFSYLRASFIEQNSRCFAGFAPFVNENFNLTDGGDPEQLPAVRVHWNFFEVLGVRPALGRDFRPEEDRPGATRVVIISDSLWRRRFSADPKVLGRKLTLDSSDATIIGVMPQDFDFDPVGRSIDVWSTRIFEFNTMGGQQAATGAPYLIAVARIGPHWQLDQAQSEMRVLDAQYLRQYGGMADSDPRSNITLNPMQELMVANVRTSVLVLFGAVGFVLLIACSNVASLLLSKGLTRRREIAVRLALGAGRGGIVRQLLTESLILSLASGALGIVLSTWSTHALALFPYRSLPHVNPVETNGRVLAFSLLVSIATSVLFGLVPALQISRPDIQAVLRDEGRSNAGGRRRNFSRSVLVVLQVALSVTLLIGAGLLIRSFLQLQAVRLGFNPRNVLIMSLRLPASRYSTVPQIAGFFDRVLARVAVLPGVRSVAVSSALPLLPARYASMRPEGQPELPLPQRPQHSVLVISPSYFETMGIRLLQGRTFNAYDREDSPSVVIVNDVFARRFWPHESAIGKHVQVGAITSEIVGVVDNVKNIRLGVQSVPELYYPLRQRSAQLMNLLVRTAGDPHALTAQVRGEIFKVDNQPVTNVRSFEEHLLESIAPNRLTTLLLGIFSGIAMVVAVVGLYGVIAYSVSQRTQEVGIRLALGATRTDILRLVIRQALLLASLGVLLGLAASFGLTRVMRSLLYDVSATDAWTFTASAALFLTVALAASYFPARRAARLEPSGALRYE